MEIATGGDMYLIAGAGQGCSNTGLTYLTGVSTGIRSTEYGVQRAMVLFQALQLALPEAAHAIPTGGRPCSSSICQFPGTAPVHRCACLLVPKLHIIPRCLPARGPQTG